MAASTDLADNNTARLTTDTDLAIAAEATGDARTSADRATGATTDGAAGLASNTGSNASSGTPTDRPAQTQTTPAGEPGTDLPTDGCLATNMSGESGLEPTTDTKRGLGTQARLRANT